MPTTSSSASSTRTTPGASWMRCASGCEEFALSLHPEKTRLIEFGRFAAERRKQRGLGKPETFNFLGFTFICGKTRSGQIPAQTEDPARPHAGEAQEIKEEMRRRMHQPIPEQGNWLRQVVHRLLHLPRGADQRPCAARVPASRHRPLAAHASAAQPKGSDHVGTDDEAGRRLAPETAHPPSLAERALCRHTPEVGEAMGRAAEVVAPSSSI